MHQVPDIEQAAFQQRFREAEGHARIVGPFPGGEAERAPAHEVGNRWLCVPPGELERRAERVAQREPNQRPFCTVQSPRHVTVWRPAHHATLAKLLLDNLMEFLQCDRGAPDPPGK